MQIPFVEVHFVMLSPTTPVSNRFGTHLGFYAGVADGKILLARNPHMVPTGDILAREARVDISLEPFQNASHAAVDIVGAHANHLASVEIASGGAVRYRGRLYSVEFDEEGQAIFCIYDDLVDDRYRVVASGELAAHARQAGTNKVRLTAEYREDTLVATAIEAI